MVFIFQNNQKRPDDQPKKPRTSYMLSSMEQKDAVLEKPSGLEVVWKVDSKCPAYFIDIFLFLSPEKLNGSKNTDIPCFGG